MKQKGVLQLASDLGCKGMLPIILKSNQKGLPNKIVEREIHLFTLLEEMDPHLLILAWKMRSRKFCEFYDHEWNVMWSLAAVYNFPEMQESVNKWIKEVYILIPCPILERKKIGNFSNLEGH